LSSESSTEKLVVFLIVKVGDEIKSKVFLCLK